MNNMVKEKTMENYLEFLANSNYNYKAWCPALEHSSPADTREYVDVESQSGFFDQALEVAGECSVEDTAELSKEGLTILHYFTMSNCLEAMRTLLERGANPNVAGGEGKCRYESEHLGVTPLHIACCYGNLGMANLLLEYGADAMALDAQGQNCFHYLAGAQHIKQDCLWSTIRNITARGLGAAKVEIAKQLPCDINLVSKQGKTPLFHLVEDIKESLRIAPAVIEVFLQLGADATVRDEQGNTPLMLAARYGHVDAVCILAKYKELVNLQNQEGETALHLTRFLTNERMFVAIVYELVDSGAEFDIENQEGNILEDYLTEEYYKDYLAQLISKYKLKRKRKSLKQWMELWNCFHYTYAQKYGEEYSYFMEKLARRILRFIDEDDDAEVLCIRDLISYYTPWNGIRVMNMIEEAGYDLNTRFYDSRDIKSNIALEFLGRGLWMEPEIVGELKNRGIDVDSELFHGYTVAYHIIKSCGGYKDVPEEKVYQGIIQALSYVSTESMNHVCQDGMSAALLAACKYEDDTILKYMIERGIDVNGTQDEPLYPWDHVAKQGETMLHIACRKDRWDTIRLLVEAGADTTITNSEGKIPAYYLSFHNCNREFFEILDLVSDFHIMDEETGVTFFMRMMRERISVENAEYLLSRGVDVRHTDFDGNTALHYATESYNAKELIPLLLEAGADMDAINVKGNTALMLLMKKKKLDLVLYLLEQGADYNTLNDENETPASYAIKNGYEVILERMTDITVFPEEE